MTDGLTPQDITAIRNVAGLGFTPETVTLPSGKKITYAELQALSSVYAPDAAPSPLANFRPPPMQPLLAGQEGCSPGELNRRAGDQGSVVHSGNTWWHLTGLPWRWHRCRAHTTSYGHDGLLQWQRCRCGGYRTPDSGWRHRNLRRTPGWDVTKAWDPLP